MVNIRSVRKSIKSYSKSLGWPYAIWKILSAGKRYARSAFFARYNNVVNDPTVK